MNVQSVKPEAEQVTGTACSAPPIAANSVASGMSSNDSGTHDTAASPKLDPNSAKRSVEGASDASSERGGGHVSIGGGETAGKEVS